VPAVANQLVRLLPSARKLGHESGRGFRGDLGFGHDCWQQQPPCEIVELKKSAPVSIREIGVAVHSLA
jgi:hypothetical protein